MTNLESLVGRLSEAQRDTLRRACLAGRTHAAGARVVYGRPSTIAALRRQGFVSDRNILTPYGAEVRAHLKSKDNG